MASAVPDRILSLVGPTAVGKTGLSLDVADAVSAVAGRPVEIVSVDSRQVYRELTIGTAKPTSEELARARHHFIDEKSLTERFSAGRFAEEADTRIGALLERGALPLVVGGSTLYLEALAHGLAPIPATTPETRAALSERLGREGATALYEELRVLDPDAAATMDPSKNQRIVRALEVLADTGRPLSYWQQQRTLPRFSYDVVVLDRPRAALYARIEQRVDVMLNTGLLDEVQGLLDQGVDPLLPALQTIGYREPISLLRESGSITVAEREKAGYTAADYAEMVRLLKRNTRRYAKRQLTWFRRHPDYTWIDVSEVKAPVLVERLRNRMLDTLH